MEYKGQKQLDLFVENTQILKKEFTWQHTLTRRLAALLYAQAGKTADCEAIRNCHELIKQNTGVFSTFRGNMVLCLATLLSLSENPKELFDKTLKVYDLLKGKKFHSSDFLAVAAYQIAGSGVEDLSLAVERTRKFYDGMKAEHMFYTGEDDYIFAAMLGISDLDPAAGVERIEKFYDRLKGDFMDKNSVQALAQMLVLGDSNDTTVDRILKLRDALRAEKIKLDKTYTLPFLGILALLPAETETIVQDIRLVQDHLRSQKGFSNWSLTNQELLLFASSITAYQHVAELKDEVLTAAISTSITNLIIAQEVAMLIVISTTAAASAASSSGS